MAKRKRSRAEFKLGALGPQPHWLRMSVAQREKTKQYIKEGLLGRVTDEGAKIPGARSIFKNLEASEGFNLTHVERWSASKLKKARSYIQRLNTLTGQPFSVLTPRTKKQLAAARKYTGQDLPEQKKMIVPIQDAKRDVAVFRHNKVMIERKFKSGTKTIKARYLFLDYGYRPETFSEMRRVTKLMLPDMPKNVYGQTAFYTIVTAQYGPIGNSSTKDRILELLDRYHSMYDPGGMVSAGHKDFAEQVIGFQMVGTFAQMSQYEISRERISRERKRRNKLRFRRRR